MSAIRKIGELLTGFLFVMGIVASVTTYNLIQISTQDVLEGIASDVFEAQQGELEIGEEGKNAIEKFSEECKENDSGIISIGDTEITCQDIELIKEEGVTSFVISEYIEDVYTGESDCDIVECIVEDKDPTTLISEDANKFYKELLNYLIVFTVAMGGLFVFLIEGIKERFKGPGFALLWASVPFIIMSLFIQNLAGFVIENFIPAELGTGIASIVAPVTKDLIGMVFMIYVYLGSIGAILVITGFLIKPSTKKQPKKKAQPM